MNYFETLNQLCQEFGSFFKRGYFLSLELSISRFNLYQGLDGLDLDHEKDIGKLARSGKYAFIIKFRSERQLGDESDPLDYSDLTAVGDSVENASKNAIELLMSKIKLRSVGDSGYYKHFGNLPIFRDKCFFTPSGLFWGDWETNTDFVCSAVRESRGDRLSPVDRDEWIAFSRIKNE